MARTAMSSNKKITGGRKRRLLLGNLSYVKKNGKTVMGIIKGKPHRA